MSSTANSGGLTFRAGRLPDFGFEIAKVGRDPATGNFLLGSYDGWVRQTSSRLVPTGPAWQASLSAEAINGIAVQGRTVAVSTRREVSLYSLDSIHLPPSAILTHQGGAHGVVATLSGSFIAPLGPDGLLSVVNPGTDASSMPIAGIPGVYLLQAAGLALDGSRETVVIAARQRGLCVLGLSADRLMGTPDSGKFWTTPGFDAVSVCSLDRPGFPYAIAALGADLSIHLCRDIREGPVDVFGIGGPPTSAYSIAQSRGHLLVHTSDGIVVLPGLAADYLDGINRPGDRGTRFIPWAASDLIVFDEIGFALLEDHAAIFFVEEVAGAPSAADSTSDRMASTPKDFDDLDGVIPYIDVHHSGTLMTV